MGNKVDVMIKIDSDVYARATEELHPRGLTVEDAVAKILEVYGNPGTEKNADELLQQWWESYPRRSKREI